LRKPPYPTALKPYGSALVEVALEREEVVCLSGDLTRQCEVDLFAEKIPERFINVGMAEANMMSLAGALARKGHIPFVHSFGVFATRRPFDQIVNSIAYPRLPVRIVGFMPGVSSPGGPSHQAIEDMAIMRAVPGMMVIDVADATETRQAVRQIVGVPGPVYLRLKRGEIPVIFEADHQFSLTAAPGRVAGHVRRGSQDRAAPVPQVRAVHPRRGGGGVVGAGPRGPAARGPRGNGRTRRVRAGLTGVAPATARPHPWTARQQRT
jgi:transketolase C-terminal domain/subunit